MSILTRQVLEILEYYRSVYEDLLAVPVSKYAILIAIAIECMLILQGKKDR